MLRCCLPVRGYPRVQQIARVPWAFSIRPISIYRMAAPAIALTSQAGGLQGSWRRWFSFSSSARHLQETELCVACRCRNADLRLEPPGLRSMVENSSSKREGYSCAAVRTLLEYLVIPLRASWGRIGMCSAPLRSQPACLNPTPI